MGFGESLFKHEAVVYLFNWPIPDFIFPIPWKTSCTSLYILRSFHTLLTQRSSLILDCEPRQAHLRLPSERFQYRWYTMTAGVGEQIYSLESTCCFRFSGSEIRSRSARPVSLLYGTSDDEVGWSATPASIQA